MRVILYFPLINNRSHKNHSVLITRLISLLLFIYDTNLCIYFHEYGLLFRNVIAITMQHTGTVLCCRGLR